MEAPGNRLLKGTKCKNTQTAWCTAKREYPIHDWFWSKKKNSCWITFDSHSYSLLNPVKISYDIIPLGRSGYDMYKSLQVLAGNILVPFGFFIIVSFFFTRVTKFDSWNEKSGIRCILVNKKLKEKSNKNTIAVLKLEHLVWLPFYFFLQASTLNRTSNSWE